MTLVQKVIGIGERVPLPDAVSQAAIKFLVGQTRRRLSRAGSDADQRFARDMAAYPIAEHVAQANAQHYEIRQSFSAGFWGGAQILVLPLR